MEQTGQGLEGKERRMCLLSPTILASSCKLWISFCFEWKGARQYWWWVTVVMMMTLRRMLHLKQPCMLALFKNSSNIVSSIAGSSAFGIFAFLVFSRFLIVPSWQGTVFQQLRGMSLVLPRPNGIIILCVGFVLIFFNKGKSIARGGGVRDRLLSYHVEIYTVCLSCRKWLC